MPVKRGGKKNRKSNKNRKNTSNCESHKRGHRAPEAEKERNEQHKLVNSFKAAASTNLFKTSLPHKFTNLDNLRRLSAEALLRAEAEPIKAETFHEDAGHPSGAAAGQSDERPSSSAAKPTYSDKHWLRPPPGFDSMPARATSSSSKFEERDPRPYRGLGYDPTKPFGWNPQSLRADAEKQKQKSKLNGSESYQTWSSELA